jgi:hypothetical protein
MEIKTYDNFICEKLVYEKGGEKKRVKRHKSTNDLTRVGYLEMVNVPEIGDFVAKFDSGNGTVSSIMCDKYEVDGDYVNWEINGRKMRSKKFGKSVVRNRNEEERVSVLLDISFNGEDYRIPFALVDRSKNYVKMLLNRLFMNTAHVMVDTSVTFLVTKKPKGYMRINKDAENSKYNGIYFKKED